MVLRGSFRLSIVNSLKFGGHLGVRRPASVESQPNDRTGGPTQTEAAPSPRGRASKLSGRFQPFGDDCLGVGYRFLPRDTIGDTARQLRDFGDKRIILAAPE
jgi:hypothetical protein